MNDIIEFEDFFLKPLTEAGIKDIEDLFKAVYGNHPERNYFKKKYNTAYTSLKYIGYIAYNITNTPIAFFSVIPCYIQHNHKIELCAQAVDAMTDIPYRNKGLFEELAKKTFDLCRAKEIKLIFGFPNQNSCHGLVHKLGWKMTENLKRFIVPVRTIPFEPFLQHFKWSKWIYNKYSNWVMKKYLTLQIGLPNSLIDEGNAGANRSEAYLQYKTYSLTKVIKIGNSFVWIKINHGLIIGDVILGETEFDLMMIKIKKIAGRLGIQQIFFQVSDGTKLCTLLTQSYQSEKSFPVIFLNLASDIPLDKIKFSFADIDIF